MKRTKLISRLFLIELVCFCTLQCYSQDNLIDHLDNSITAVVVVNQPRDFVRYFKELGIDEDVRWKRAIELAVDDTFGIISAADLELALSKVESVVQSLEAASEFGIVWHGAATGDNPYDFSVVIRCREEQKAITAQIAKWFETLIKEVNAGASLNISVNACQNTDWIVISNSPKGQELASKLDSGPSKKNLLTSSRRFQRVFGDPSVAEGERPALYLYGDVEKLSKVFFYADLTPKLQEEYKFDEFVGVGLTVSFKKLSASDSRRSVVFELVAPCTLPKSGLAKLFDSYRPLGELPPIPIEFFELNAAAFDPTRRHEITRQIHDSANGKGSYDAENQAKWQHRGLSYVDDVMPKSDKIINVKFQNDGYDQNSVVVFEHIHDPKATERYVNAITNYQNNDPERPIYKKRAGKYGDIYKASSMVPTYLVSPNWFIIGLNGNHVELIDRLLFEKLQSFFGKKGDGFRVRFVNFSRLDWSEEDENERLAEKVGYEGYHKKAKSGPGWQKYKVALNRKPDEFGLRIVVEDKKDCLVAVERLVVPTVLERFGNLVLSYHNESSGVRIVGGIISPTSTSKKK